MKRLRFASLTWLIGILTAPAWADDAPADVPAELTALKAEFQAANTKFREEQKAKGPNAIYRAEDSPDPAFAPRFLQFAQDHPDSPEALPALNLALQTAISARKDGGDVWTGALQLIRDRYVADPAVRRFYRSLSFASDDPAGEAVLREIFAKNPDRDTRGGAAQCLVKRVERTAQLADRIRSSPESLKDYQEREGKAKLDEVLASGDRAKAQVETLKDSFRADYADFFPAIAIGQPAPEVVLHDVNGGEVRLSSMKGKVVVLDIWTTWCGPCNAMIPHEREMVERLKDKPFALIGISCDEEKSALVEFLAKQPLHWTQCWNGPTGGIALAWEVSYYPTIYVIDAEGVIRHKDLRDEELEKAVSQLLSEPAAPAPAE